MSLYAAQSVLQANYDFVQRVQACIVQETKVWEPPADVGQILTDIMPDVAASPGFAAKYLYGDQGNDVLPGQTAIADAEILATVQPMLAVYRPEVTP